MSPPSTMCGITSKPLDKKKLHVLRLRWFIVRLRPSIHDRSMVNAYYLTKPVGECLSRVHIVLIFIWQSYKVSVCSWVQQILDTLGVIHYLVHTEGVVFVNAIIYDYKSIVLLCCEWVLVAIVLAPEQAAKKVLLKLRNEILNISQVTSSNL